MKEKFLFSYYYKFSLLCAVAYCVPVCFFLANETYTNLWVLYLGNVLYVMFILVSGIFVTKKLNDSPSFNIMITSGAKVIFSSILIICIFLAIILLIDKYSFGGVVKAAPDKTDSLYYMLPLDAILANCLIGFFGVVLGASAIRQNQKNARGQDIT
jgi:hypothetical protein